jgi:hypothetical protein
MTPKPAPGQADINFYLERLQWIGIFLPATDFTSSSDLITLKTACRLFGIKGTRHTPQNNRPYRGTVLPHHLIFHLRP